MMVGICVEGFWGMVAGYVKPVDSKEMKEAKLI